MLNAGARTRWIVAVALLVLPAVAVLGSFLAWQDVLPERVASHWSDAGAADDTLPTMGVFWFALGVTGAAAIAAIVTAMIQRVPARAKRAALCWIGMPAGLAVTIWLVPTWLTIQAGAAEDAVLGPWIIAFLACALYGAIPYAVAPRAHLEVAEPAEPVEPIELGSTEVGAWSRTITANIFVWASLVLVVLAGVIYVPMLVAGEAGGATFGLLIMAVALVLVASFIRLRVSVDWRGLRVTSLVLGIPLKRIPLDRVRSAQATELRPGEWGGWGYRIMPGRSAIVLRTGPGLVVTTTSDTQFAVSLADPQTPAALLDALRGQHVG
ncbi:SdpI family protein [Agromyces aerolatus]|uniref:hypothetical protein n=1 Tax=Agromyces sp. LY-1074 TaxID=3074080 RepID=UPI00285D277A|nr:MULTISPECIES: hypothetical protein [unclassified Agromyces]MDR5699212.1 hypothetical protein [Agromyces sp. LY-1074]MDR5705508.1 hypothetical protein [Agromyces sp. LY-1358]